MQVGRSVMQTGSRVRRKRGATATAAAALAMLAAPAPSDAQQPAPDPLSEHRGPIAASASTGASEFATSAAKGKRSSNAFRFGYADPLFLNPDSNVRDRALREAEVTNADVLRLEVGWPAIAPADPSGSFEATDPASPEYSWETTDAAIADAVSRGFMPLLMIHRAPAWAEGGGNRPGTDVAPLGTWKPQPKHYREFAIALARRYSGGFQGLPRVNHFMPMNEPNLPTNLMPQWKGKSGKKPASPQLYVKILNAFYEGVNSIDRKNVVITAGTAPYGFPKGEYSMRPLLFWRQALCVKGGGKPKAKSRCKLKPKFDVLAHHPINTSGGPDRSALHPDDVSTPDLHNLVDVLRAAEKGKNVRPGGRRPVWATEIWWESNPPDDYFSNPSLGKQARWYVEALHSLWKQGAEMVLLYQIRDERHYGEPGRFTGSSYETGVYFVDWQPKPSAQGVSFPFLADRKSKRKVNLWGEAPAQGKLKVVDQSKKKIVARFKVKEGKLFNKKINLRGKAKLKAKVGGEESLAWKLK